MRAGIAVLAGVVIGLGAMFAADRTGVINLTADEGTTTTSPPTTVEADETTTTSSPVDPAIALWPQPGSDQRFDSPEAVARSFAVDYLGFREVTVGPFRAGDPSSGEVPIQATVPGPVTNVLVRQLEPGQWWVTGAATESIRVDAPQPGALATSPLHVSGAAHTFEGNVQIQVRADGAAAPVGEGFVTGAGDQLGPFEGDITFDESAARPAGYGAVIFYESSARDGSITQATVHRVRF